jgi:hypothetical protein
VPYVETKTAKPLAFEADVMGHNETRQQRLNKSRELPSDGLSTFLKYKTIPSFGRINPS